jgi:hypothetical protein
LQRRASTGHGRGIEQFLTRHSRPLPVVSRPSIVDLLRGLPARPSPQALEPVAQALADKAAEKRVPLKSVAATLRTHGGHVRLSKATVAELTRRAGDILAESRRDNLPTEKPEYCGEERAAILLDLRLDNLRRLLIDPGQRRLVGYPYWTGSESRFPLAALRSETHHDYVAALPDHDPLPELLPPWCRRGPATAGDDAQTAPPATSSRLSGPSDG